jgi:hypothetical protein
MKVEFARWTRDQGIDRQQGIGAHLKQDQRHTMKVGKFSADPDSCNLMLLARNQSC